MIARQPEAAAPAPSADGVPMDGAFAAPMGAAPAITAPVPATTAPPATAARAPADAAPAPSASKGAGTDDLMTNIEQLLKRDAPTAPAAPADAASPTTAGPTALGVPASDALPELPPADDGSFDTTASGDALLPPPPEGTAPTGRRVLLPPADIPNQPPAGSTGIQ